MSRQRAKGTSWESQIVDFLRTRGWPHAERRALGGARDRGDIAGIPGVVIEAKNAARIELATWLDEAETERGNDNADLGAVWFKRKGRASAAKGYVLIDGDTFVWLLRSAGYGQPVTPEETNDRSPRHGEVG